MDFAAIIETLTSSFERILTLVSRADVSAFITKLILLIEKVA